MFPSLLTNPPFTLAPSLDRMFQEFFRPSRELRRDSDPPARVLRNDTGYAVEFEVPGIPKDAIEIGYHDGVLTISGERPAPEIPGRELREQHRWSGKFSRRLTLPKDADGDEVSASLENGLLVVRVPKRADLQPRRIAIQ